MAITKDEAAAINEKEQETIKTIEEYIDSRLSAEYCKGKTVRVNLTNIASRITIRIANAVALLYQEKGWNVCFHPSTSTDCAVYFDLS